MAVELVDFQVFIGTEHDQSDYSMRYDMTSLPILAGDVVVAGLWTQVTGGGSLWFNDYGAGNTNKTNGPWSDIVTLGTAWDDSGGAGIGIQAGGYLVHTVTTQMDDGMLAFGWSGGNFTNNLNLGLVVWVFRGGTYVGLVDTDGAGQGNYASSEVRHWTPTTTLAGPLADNQAYLGFAGTFNNSGTHQVSTVTNDMGGVSDDVAEAWTAFQPYDGTIYGQVEVPDGTEDDPSSITWDLTLGAGTGSDLWVASVHGAIIEFDESFIVVPPAPASRIELPRTRLSLHQLPNKLNDASLRELS